MKRLATVTVLVLLALTSSQTQADPPAPAWVSRVERALKRLLGGEGLQIAVAIQKITHPSGSSPSLSNYTIIRVGPEVKDGPDDFIIDATMTVAWVGALGASRTTSVKWGLGHHEHFSAIVVADDAPVGVSKVDAERLDDYFRRLYPTVMQFAGVR